MKLKQVLFDLDGTLLPMDLKAYIDLYMKELCARFAGGLGSPEALVKALWTGVAAMSRNDGSRTNQEAFWSVFSAELGVDMTSRTAEFDDFYSHEFTRCFAACRPNPAARILIDRLHELGISAILATNPQFPLCAVANRLGWIGLSTADFDLVTSYESSHYSKPNPLYYREVLERTGIPAEESIMVGNDVNEDILPSAEVGLSSLLVTDCMLGDASLCPDTPALPFSGLLPALEALAGRP